MNKLINFLIGPEITWLLFYIVTVMIVGLSGSPTKSMDSFWISMAYIVPLILIPLTFGLYYVPGVIKNWLLLRIWVSGVIWGHYVLSKSLESHSEQGPGVGTAYIMGMIILLFVLVVGSVWAKIKF